MKWLQDNPLGMALAAACGVLALLALGMGVVWTLPVSVDMTDVAIEDVGGNQVAQAARPVAPEAEFRIVNERPVFNENRLPVVVEVADDEDEADLSIEIKDAPKVRLTGVIITPSMKIASLTPADSDVESIMAHEGEALTGKFVGWQVSRVNPRAVVLESRDGRTLDLDLQVHDAKIKEPPKAVADTKPAAKKGEVPTGEDGEPLSRAEQIRQRIAERREELRREQEEKKSGGGAKASSAKAAKPQDYQSAIRAMMKNNSKDKGSDDKKDG